MKNHSGMLREGMTVFSIDGQKLGKIVRCDADSFIIEKGIFFPKDYLCRHADVNKVEGDEVWLLVNKDDLLRIGEGVDTGAGYDTARAGRDSARVGATREVGEREDMRVSAVEEELEAHKRVREGGGVTIRKDVKMEEKHITVPVMHEEVHVERHAVNRPAGPGDDARFEGDTIRVPVREEEVEIRKRPVVREEVRVTKTPHVEQRVASETVRREEIDVDREGDTERKVRRDRSDDKKIV